MRLKNILFAALALISAVVFVSCQSGTPAEVEPVGANTVSTLVGDYALIGLDSSRVVTVSIPTSQDSTSTISEASISIKNIGSDSIPLSQPYIIDIVRQTELLNTTLYSTNKPNIVFYQTTSTTSVSDTTGLASGDTLYLSIESNLFYRR